MCLSFTLYDFSRMQYIRANIDLPKMPSGLSQIGMLQELQYTVCQHICELSKLREAHVPGVVNQ
jgi:hypothetical protein